MALEDKTEAPTPRKRTESRKEGQVARSVEISSALVMLVGLVLIKMTGPNLAVKLKGLMIESLTRLPTGDVTPEGISHSLVRILLGVGIAIVPLLAGLMIVGFVANAAQVGLTFSVKPMLFKPAKLNPLPGFARMFSMQSAVELIKSVAKIIVIGYIVFAFLKQKYPEIASLAGCDYVKTVSVIGGLTYGVLIRATLALLIIAIFDYAFRRRQHESQIKMTKQEVKEENKQQEGNPEVKGRLRQKQREISQRRMMAEVPKADVVVTNPTHFAVALRYDSTENAAPVVLAKGQRYIAMKIREIAEANNIPIVENVQLARTLYASVEIGDPIPADLYQAVAEVLAYVYKLTKRKFA
jgi:flagellar biosynthesis protein FlhB